MRNLVKISVSSCLFLGSLKTPESIIVTSSQAFLPLISTESTFSQLLSNFYSLYSPVRTYHLPARPQGQVQCIGCFHHASFVLRANWLRKLGLYDHVRYHSSQNFDVLHTQFTAVVDLRFVSSVCLPQFRIKLPISRCVTIYSRLCFVLGSYTL